MSSDASAQWPCSWREAPCLHLGLHVSRIVSYLHWLIRDCQITVALIHKVQSTVSQVAWSASDLCVGNGSQRVSVFAIAPQWVIVSAVRASKEMPRSLHCNRRLFVAQNLLSGGRSSPVIFKRLCYLSSQVYTIMQKACDVLRIHQIGFVKSVEFLYCAWLYFNSLSQAWNGISQTENGISALFRWLKWVMDDARKRTL